MATAIKPSIKCLNSCKGRGSKSKGNITRPLPLIIVQGCVHYRAFDIEPGFFSTCFFFSELATSNDTCMCIPCIMLMLAVLSSNCSLDT